MSHESFCQILGKITDLVKRNLQPVMLNALKNNKINF
jgi:hypothetical protein